MLWVWHKAEFLGCLRRNGQTVISNFVLSGLAVLASVAVCRRWTLGLVMIITWDAVRDPIRKLLPQNIVTLSMFGAGLWCFCLIGCLAREKKPTNCRRLSAPEHWLFTLMLIYLIVGLVAGWRSGQPVQVLALGFVSVLLPAVGFLVGRELGNRPALFFQLLAYSCVINAILIGSAFLDLSGIRTTILGGIQMEWYRMRDGYSIPLPSGVFRSPDVLGLHAALVIAYSVLLSLASDSTYHRRKWLFLTFWGSLVLVLSARRKMIGFSLIFLITLLVSYRQESKSLLMRGWQWTTPARTFRLTVGFFLAIFTPAFFFASRQLDYAWTTLTDLPERLRTSLTASLTTLYQSGPWGKGLGAVTQGRAHLTDSLSVGWQEDGLSRFMLEAGVLGFALAVSSVALFVVSTSARIRAFTAIHRAHRNKRAFVLLLSGSFSLIVAHLGCGLISHLHLSGDPIVLGFLGMFGGCCWATGSKVGGSLIA